MARIPRKPPTDKTSTTIPQGAGDDTAETSNLMRVRPLGYNHGRFFYYSVATKQVEDMSSTGHNKNALMGMAPLSYWHNQFGAANGKVDWDAAASQCMANCRVQGVYNPDRVRGRGAWFDAGRTVLHLGNQLQIDGELHPLSDMESYYIYEAGAAIKPPSREALTATEARAVIRLARRLRWSLPVSAYLLAGFCVIAPICGALAWRPHVWVTGGAGTGKSTVAMRFMRPLMGQSTVHVQGATTEAGLRQKLGNDALPVLFDEAESGDKGAQDRIQQVLEMMRSSSSDAGALIKGSTSGVARSVTFHSCFALVSINPGIKAAADRGRVSFLTLKPAPSITEAERAETEVVWNALSADLDNVLSPAFCEAFFARSVKMLPIIRINAGVFGDAITAHLGQRRLGDQLGTLLAGAYSLMSDEKVSPADAKAFVEQQEWAESEDALNNQDHEQCLRHLLQSTIQAETNDLRHVTRSIAELAMLVTGLSRDTRIDRQEVETASGRTSHEIETEIIAPEKADTTLRRHGIRAERAIGGVATLTVANQHVSLAKIFSGTPWPVNWGEQLKRLSFAIEQSAAVRFPKTAAATPKTKVRVTQIDLDKALELA